MKQISIISFTEHGSKVGKNIESVLEAEGIHVSRVEKYKNASAPMKEKLSEWTASAFCEQDAIIFVSAMGIAVRAIAPYVASKTSDPAVIVVDEQGKYCIPILSGHIGGANQLAEIIAEKIGARPIITTATDLNQKWAVDVFAVKNKLIISNLIKAKEISARILDGEKISVYVEDDICEIVGKVPDSLRLICKSEKCDEIERNLAGTHLQDCITEPDIVIGVRTYPQWKTTLQLIPSTVSIGVGCKKGTETEKIEEKILSVLRENEISGASSAKVVSIDLKKEEEGILIFCERYGLQFETYDAQTLENVPGEYSASEFVKQATGVDNVCERSAVCGSDGGALIVQKQAGDGVTVAVAAKKRRIRFE